VPSQSFGTHARLVRVSKVVVYSVRRRKGENKKGFQVVWNPTTTRKKENKFYFSSSRTRVARRVEGGTECWAKEDVRNKKRIKTKQESFLFLLLLRLPFPPVYHQSQGRTDPSLSPIVSLGPLLPPFSSFKGPATGTRGRRPGPSYFSLSISLSCMCKAFHTALVEKRRQEK
jgi:hypothetical protein